MFFSLSGRESEIKRLKAIQKTQINDEYSCGVYNGLELASAILDSREPEFAEFSCEPEIIEGTEEAERVGRTVASGVIRRGKNRLSI